MSDRKIKFCDLCEERIELSVVRDIMISGGEGYQRWPVKEEIYDVCSRCCLVLVNAKQVGIASFSEESIFARAGYIKNNEYENGTNWVNENSGHQIWRTQ